MTGDLQSVDINRTLFIKPITMRKYRQLTNLCNLFDLPTLNIQKALQSKPIYYDALCSQQDLHLVVEYDYDENDQEILVISVPPSFTYNQIGS